MRCRILQAIVVVREAGFLGADAALRALVPSIRELLVEAEPFRCRRISSKRRCTCSHVSVFWNLEVADSRRHGIV